MSGLGARRNWAAVAIAATTLLVGISPASAAPPAPPADGDTTISSDVPVDPTASASDAEETSDVVVATDPTLTVAATPVTDMATIDAVTAAAATCTVSAILVPSCGAWAGASAPSKSGYDPARGLQEYEAVTGAYTDILHFYQSGASSFPSKSQIALAQRTGKQRSIMLFNWQPAPTKTWKQIAQGGADSAIQSVANSIKAYPYKIMLAIAHEPENDMNQTASSGKTPEDFVAMNRYVVTKLRALGVKNAVFVWNVMGYSGWASYYDRLYPGHDVVDWIAWDAYGHKAQTNFTNYIERPKTKINWPGFYTWATRKAPGKPLMLGEWGYDLAGQPNAPSILGEAASVLSTKFPMIKAMVYWNSSTSRYTYRLDQNTTVGKAYGAAYATLVKNSYFNLTATSAAP